MSIKRPGTLTSPDLAFTYRVRPICGGDLALIRSALAEFAPDWSVELQGFCADEAIIVVVPEDGDDVTGPSFMISRETYGFRVDQVHWDVVTEVGVTGFDERGYRRGAASAAALLAGLEVTCCGLHCTSLPLL